MQTTKPGYEKFAAAKSFFYRARKRHQQRHETPHLEPHRDRRGENRIKTKRENPAMVVWVDDLLSEPKQTAPKVQSSLVRHDHRLSLSTIYRIAKDVLFHCTKPWHTDVLTPAQKFKRKLFCARLLRLSDEALLRDVAQCMFTDEKWWDLVGPAAAEYCKGATVLERKKQNQVTFYCCCFCFIF